MQASRFAQANRKQRKRLAQSKPVRLMKSSPKLNPVSGTRIAPSSTSVKVMKIGIWSRVSKAPVETAVPLVSKFVLATSLVTLKKLGPVAATMFPIVVGFSGSAQAAPAKPRINAEAGRVTFQESPVPFRVTRIPAVDPSYFTSRLVEESSVGEILCPRVPPK